MLPFHPLFEELAKNEVRVLNISDGDPLPKGAYLFTEAYCSEPRCDCRRVWLQSATVGLGDKMLAKLSDAERSRSHTRSAIPLTLLAPAGRVREREVVARFSAAESEQPSRSGVGRARFSRLPQGANAS